MLNLIHQLIWRSVVEGAFFTVPREHRLYINGRFLYCHVHLNWYVFLGCGVPRQTRAMPLGGLALGTQWRGAARLRSIPPPPAPSHIAKPLKKTSNYLKYIFFFYETKNVNNYKLYWYLHFVCLNDNNEYFRCTKWMEFNLFSTTNSKWI